MYYDSLYKIVFILLALTVPANYILFRIKPNLLHFKALENKIIKIIAMIPISISLIIFILKLIEETYFLPDMFLDIFYPWLEEPNCISILIVLTMWSICILKLTVLRIILNIIFLVSGIFWLLGHQHHFYIYQIYTIISLNAAILGLNMYPYKENNTSIVKVLDIVLVWIAIIVFSFIYQQPMM